MYYFFRILKIKYSNNSLINYNLKITGYSENYWIWNIKYYSDRYIMNL